MATEGMSLHLTPARFLVEIELPTGIVDDLANAAEAVKREYRSSVRWKRLRCRSVTLVSKTNAEAIYVIEVGQSVEFDWTWEGATAFRPVDIDNFNGNADAADDFLGNIDGNAPGRLWSGEVVEVDEANGRVFVWVSDPTSPPTTGSFFVRPFEFLAFLYAIYCDPAFQGLRRVLPARLNASRGEVHPEITGRTAGGLESLQRMWAHSWGVLWGPPGTGKTYTVGQQLAKCLGDPTERILVVSTTNKATDEAALSIGRAVRQIGTAALDSGRILRIGKSAHYETFEAEELAGMLRGTETDLLRQVGHLTRALNRAETHEQRADIRKQMQAIRRQMKDASFNAFIMADVRVVVATSFKAMTLLNDASIRSCVEEGMAPFTTIIIDEAGLISRSAVSVLSLLASRRVLLVGDSKQLAPISRISRVLPTTQATWLASSGLSHLWSLEQAHDAVHLLREQHRMHPHICSVVSAYQYENKLINAPTVNNRAFQLPSLLTGHLKWTPKTGQSNKLLLAVQERGKHAKETEVPHGDVQGAGGAGSGEG